MNLNAQQITKVAVIGLGMTGQSCVRFLLKQGLTPVLFDTRAKLDLAPIEQQFGQLEVHLGCLSDAYLSSFELLLVSPGVAISNPAIKQAADRGCLIWGDIELFSYFVQVPVIAITGSNGKTTVTTLLGAMAEQAGVNAAIAGNIGVPVLDLVSDHSIELFILELSSFQLETTHQLNLCCATILNLSDDHLDRYDDFSGYVAAKQRIYHHSETVVTNRQDRLTIPVSTPASKHYSFGNDAPRDDWQYGITDQGLYRGERLLIATEDIAMIGKHNQLNALAAITLGTIAGLPMAAMVATLKTFSGLEHRCQQISNKGGVRWLNDSKATNVGATLAALDGLSDHEGQLIVIVGGDAKGADVSALQQPFANHVDQLIVIGRDKQLFSAIYPGAISCDDLTSAVITANKYCHCGDIVLLSPACASLDMFNNYIERGQCFITAVEGL